MSNAQTPLQLIIFSYLNINLILIYKISTLFNLNILKLKKEL